MHTVGMCNSKWINFVKSILDNAGFSYVWNNQSFLCSNEIKLSVKKILQDQFVQKWNSETINSSRGEFYSIFKTDFGLENYLLRLMNNRRIIITKLRCSNIKFPIETGRWNNTMRAERLCKLCSRGIGDEFHYLFLCKPEFIQVEREKYIPQYFIQNPSKIKLKGMLSLCNKRVLNNLSIFLTKIVKLL